MLGQTRRTADGLVAEWALHRRIDVFLRQTLSTSIRPLYYGKLALATATTTLLFTLLMCSRVSHPTHVQQANRQCCGLAEKSVFPVPTIATVKGGQNCHFVLFAIHDGFYPQLRQ